MFVHPVVDGPAVLQIGCITLTFYGILYLVALVSFLILGEYRLKQYQYFTSDEFDTFFHYAAFSVVMGGYLGEILFYQYHRYDSIFFTFPQNTLVTQNAWLSIGIWCVWNLLSKLFNFSSLSIIFLAMPCLFLCTGGIGMSFHGSLIGALIAVLLYSYRFNKNGLDILDFVTPLVPPGLGLGRIANFINGELWGRVTQMPWGVVFPRIDLQVRHPSQLYEFALEGVLLFAILWPFSRSKKPRGMVFGGGMALYAIFRMFVECFREPDPQIGIIAWGWLTRGQLLSLPMLVGGLYFFLQGYYFLKKKPAIH